LYDAQTELYLRLSSSAALAIPPASRTVKKHTTSDEKYTARALKDVRINYPGGMMNDGVLTVSDHLI